MGSAYFSSNVTKYNAGGSGDNQVQDGYIKTVEKIWLDSYTIAFVLTKTTLDIAILQPNKKLTGVTVMIETSASQTNGTLSLGWSEDSAFGTILQPVTISHNLTASTISLHAPGIVNAVAALAQASGNINAFGKVTAGTLCTVTLQINNWTMTTGTIKSIVRYT